MGPYVREFPKAHERVLASAVKVAARDLSTVGFETCQKVQRRCLPALLSPMLWGSKCLRLEELAVFIVKWKLPATFHQI